MQYLLLRSSQQVVKTGYLKSFHPTEMIETQRLNKTFHLVLSLSVSVCVCPFECTRAGNSNDQFSIDRQTGLVTRGLNPLDRETKSSHVLDVEAYNSDESIMRSSVRVRRKISELLTCTY